MPKSGQKFLLNKCKKMKQDIRDLTAKANDLEQSIIDLEAAFNPKLIKPVVQKEQPVKEHKFPRISLIKREVLEKQAAEHNEQPAAEKADGSKDEKKQTDEQDSTFMQQWRALEKAAK